MTAPVAALETLNAILAAGGRMEPGAERTRLISPKTMRPLVEANREGLRALVDAHGHCPADVFRRALAFKRQADAWAASGRGAVPVLVLPEAPAPKLGHCVSCGCTIAGGWRCDLCLAAVHIALGIGPTEP